MRLFKTLFGKSNKFKSDESDILSLVLRVTNQDSNGDRDINLSGAATLLLNINEHPFFTDINSSLKELEKELLIPTVGTPLRGFKSDMYNSCWIIFENTNNQEMVAEINTTIKVSPNDWKMTCPLLPPITFRIPTSLLLPMACAVERLTKLIEAISSINIPIKAKV